MSAKVYIKRTFHPVGQGAFFTEQFYNDDATKASSPARIT